MTTYNLASPTLNLRYQAKQTENGGSVFVKNTVIAYQLTSSACTEITDIDYPAKHTYTLSSLTSSSTTATATTSITNSLVTGDSVVIAGADQTEYNGTYTITVTGGTTFTYTFAGSATTPATGTITAVGGKTTVPGVVYLDTYIFVQDTDGAIWNSSAGDETTWNALSFITPENEPSNAVAIAKSISYLVAFKNFDTEFFYIPESPAASPASPLTRNNSTYLKLGCAAADSIVEFDGGIVFMSKRDNLQRSREIHVLNGLTPKKVSTASVERILNGDDLATCYACYLSTAGHQFYMLTLKTSAITLVYDFNNGLWYQWTFLTAQSAQSITAGNLTSSDITATCTLTAHGFNDGDPVLIAGANEAAYNGTFNITKVDANTFTYTITATTSPATGTITAVGYNESYFPIVSYATYSNLDLVLHETNGIIYSLEPAIYQDNSVPINTHIRLTPWDNGNNANKMVSKARISGDLVSSDALLRYSDDDHSTFSDYIHQDMSDQNSLVSRLGTTQRRVYEIRHTANTFLRIDVLEQDFSQGR